MLTEIFAFLVESDWTVNSTKLHKIQNSDGTCYVFAKEVEDIDPNTIFTLQDVVEVELNFRNHSAKIWTAG